MSKFIRRVTRANFVPAVSDPLLITDAMLARFLGVMPESELAAYAGAKVWDALDEVVREYNRSPQTMWQNFQTPNFRLNCDFSDEGGILFTRAMWFQIETRSRIRYRVLFMTPEEQDAKRQTAVQRIIL